MIARIWRASPVPTVSSLPAPRSPRRILLLGSPGSGKSTLAHRLGRATGLPVVHVDDLYWRAGWTRPDPAEFDDVVERVCRGEQWILDGNYAPTLDLRAHHADAAIVLHTRPIRCCWRLVRRAQRIANHAAGEHRPRGLDVTDPPADDLPALVRKAARFPSRDLPVVLASLQRHRVPILEATHVARLLASQPTVDERRPTVIGDTDHRCRCPWA